MAEFRALIPYPGAPTDDPTQEATTHLETTASQGGRYMAEVKGRTLTEVIAEVHAVSSSTIRGWCCPR